MSLQIGLLKWQNRIMPKPRGFTLIELLITISIIAIISAIGFVVYSVAMKQGRDSKRQSDLRSIQSALEQYYADQGFYPYSTTTSGNPGFGEVLGYTSPESFTNWIGNPCDPALPGDCPSVKSYINSLPQDPAGGSYSYLVPPDNSCDNSTPSTKCTSYCLYAKLENTSSGLGSCPVNSSYNFAVAPP